MIFIDKYGTSTRPAKTKTLVYLDDKEYVLDEYHSISFPQRDAKHIHIIADKNIVTLNVINADSVSIADHSLQEISAPSSTISTKISQHTTFLSCGIKSQIEDPQKLILESFRRISFFEEQTLRNVYEDSICMCSCIDRIQYGVVHICNHMYRTEHRIDL